MVSGNILVVLCVVWCAVSVSLLLGLGFDNVVTCMLHAVWLAVAAVPFLLGSSM